MKRLIFFFFLFINCSISYSQSISCEDLKEELESEANLENSVTCFGSTALVKAEYYTYEGNSFVIVYLKSNNYDFRGKPYVFCGISYSIWNRFVSEGRYGSWGKSFDMYIKDYLCKCN